MLDEVAVRSAISGKRVLITGAAGCVGGALIERLVPYSPALLAGLDLQAFSRAGITAIQGDVRDACTLEQTLRSGEFAPTPSIASCPRAGPARHQRTGQEPISAHLRTADFR
jgi:hypothetical protein